MKTTLEYHLFEDYKLGNTELKNRIVMSPMTRCRAINNLPNELMATYYSQRAGAGLIITEGTAPSADGLGYARIPGIYTKEQIDGWRIVTDQVHAAGGKIFLQIMHCGRVCHPLNMEKNTTIWSASPIALKNTKMYVDDHGELPTPIPVEMDIKTVKATIQEYITAAQNAIMAGFDGVELHGANGYLIDQFLNPASNKRYDLYGGNFENRSRFLLEIVEGVINKIGHDRVGIRLSPYGVMNEMNIYEDIDAFFMYLVTQLNRLNPTYIHLVDHESMGAPRVPAELKLQLRTIFNNTLILSGGYNKENAEKDISERNGDLIAFGRPYIANPDLVGRMTENARLAIPDNDTFYTPGEKGYIDYPYLKK